MFLYPLGNGQNPTCFKGGGLTLRKHIFSYICRTKVVIRSKTVANSMNRESRIYVHFEAVCIVECVCDIKCKLAVNEFRSCCSHKQQLSFFCLANITNIGNILF